MTGPLTITLAKRNGNKGHSRQRTENSNNQQYLGSESFNVAGDGEKQDIVKVGEKLQTLSSPRQKLGA